MHHSIKRADLGIIANYHLYLVILNFGNVEHVFDGTISR